MFRYQKMLCIKIYVSQCLLIFVNNSHCSRSSTQFVPVQIQYQYLWYQVLVPFPEPGKRYRYANSEWHEHIVTEESENAASMQGEQGKKYA